MNREDINVTMTIETYERLKADQADRDRLMKMLERAHKNGVAVLTDELKGFIELQIL